MSGHRSKRVQVWVRVRPTSYFAHDMLDLHDEKTIQVHRDLDKRGQVNNQQQDWAFRLDGVMNNTSQEQVYQTIGANIVNSTLDGYNGTIMCYGQTGAGKTFTMSGATENYRNRGIIPRSLSQIFRQIEDRPEDAVTIKISYLEIYNETMFDLLTTLPQSMDNFHTPLVVVEDERGVLIKGLTQHIVHNEEEALNLLFEGETNRAIAEHSLNSKSSRSHTIFTVYVESHSRVKSEAKYTMSKLNFVDLAGSERLSKTKSEGKTQQEAMYINKSLTFLEQTVIALADRRRDFIPFRQTKLTHCLKDSIGGNCNSLLVANIWGEAPQIEETISTLRFATRMMDVISEPAICAHYDPVILVKQLEGEVRALKQELAMHDTLTNRTQISYDALSEQQRYEIKQQVRQYIEGSLEEIDIINIKQIQGVFEAFRDLHSEVQRSIEDSDLERDIEERFKARYTLLDKTDQAAIAAAQEAGIPVGDDGELVGESDRQSFGVGPASPTAKPSQSSVVNARKKEAKKAKGKERVSPGGKAASPSQSGKIDGSQSQTPSGEKKDDREEVVTPASITAPPPRPSTPPKRTEAFEDFKKELGSKINEILLENKEQLALKKKEYANMAREINQIKMEIDATRDFLDDQKLDRENQGPMINAEGETVITQEEYESIKKLHELKENYRNNFHNLRQTKSEIFYCQKLVDQTRQRLIQEFDTWYADSFLSTADHAPQSSLHAVLGQGQTEDEQEKQERLQMALLMEDPDSVAFHNARMRTERRKNYEAAMSQAQPSMRRKPGTPTRSLRGQPPNSMLEVQY